MGMDGDSVLEGITSEETGAALREEAEAEVLAFELVLALVKVECTRSELVDPTWTGT